MVIKMYACGMAKSSNYYTYHLISLMLRTLKNLSQPSLSHTHTDPIFQYSEFSGRKPLSPGATPPAVTVL